MNKISFLSPNNLPVSLFLRIPRISFIFSFLFFFLPLTISTLFMKSNPVALNGFVLPEFFNELAELDSAFKNWKGFFCQSVSFARILNRYHRLFPFSGDEPIGFINCSSAARREKPTSTAWTGSICVSSLPTMEQHPIMEIKTRRHLSAVYLESYCDRDDVNRKLCSADMFKINNIIANILLRSLRLFWRSMGPWGRSCSHFAHHASSPHGR